MEDLKQECEFWKEVACYLADCHAANTSIAELKRTSKYERGRLAEIMRKARSFLKKEECPPRYSVRRTLDDVVKRLDENINFLEERFPEAKKEA